MPFAHPHRNVSQFGLSRTMHIADIGAGSGFYALALAPLVPEGKVYAIDVQKDLLMRLQQEASQKKFFNIEIIWGDAEVLGGTKLGEASMDAVLISNVLFQAQAKNIFLQEAYRITKPEGRLFLIDWIDSFGGMGPSRQQLLPEAQARTIAQSVGWEHREDFDPGEHHYGLQFIKKDPTNA
jgi:ubiquinone/menaquinone biosynthesis C-methylase UbiE